MRLAARAPHLMTLLIAGLCSAGPEDRQARTQQALAELEELCARAEARGQPTLYSRAPLLVGRLALAAAGRAPAAERARILDHIYESCLRAKLAVLEATDGRRRQLAVPRAFSLAEVRLRQGSCRLGDRLVFPVAVQGGPPASVREYFAGGRLARTVPALAGATPENVEQTEVYRVHQREALSRRAGWERPAGGFVREAVAGKPPVLICLDDPRMRQAIALETAKALAGLREAQRPLCLSLGGGWFYVDYSELTAARYLAWLRQRHGSLRLVNALWGTDYGRFDAAMMPRPEHAAASPARWVDWTAFNHYRFTEHVRWAVANVHEAAPRLPVAMAPFAYAFAGSFGLSGVDPVALCSVVDVVELDGGGPMQADLAASLVAGKRPISARAIGPGPFGVLPHVLHGVAAVELRAWPPAPLTSVGAVRDAERALREALDARRLAAVLGALARAPRPVALLYSEASLRLAPPWALRCAETPYTRELARAHEAARALGVGCGFLPSRAFAETRFTDARVVVVAGSPCEDDRVVRALLEHVETGGHLVVIAGALVADAYGREADYLLRLGIEVRETARPTYTTALRPERGGALDDLVVRGPPQATPTPVPDGPLAWLKRPLKGVGVRQRVQVNVRHEVLAVSADGSPAIVSFPRGKGRVTYLATPLQARDLAAVLRVVLDAAGVRPLVRVVGPGGGEAAGVECRSVRHEGRIAAYAWNTTAEARRVTLQAPAARSAVNLSTGESLGIETAEGATVVGELRLAPGETAVVEIRPASADAP